MSVRQLAFVDGLRSIGQKERETLLLTVYTTSIFVSALMLFSIQPMFAKFVLPVLGGAPAVWSVAMVFYQMTLLLGYAYAHGLTRFLSPRVAVVVHVCVLLVATISLPIGMAVGWETPPNEGLHGWVLAMFAFSIGLPFFALSANGPLLQAWFARTGHSQGSDPYFLYAASNVGSLLALLGYLVIMEPLLTLDQQAGLWSFGYSVLVVMVALSAIALLVFGRGDMSSIRMRVAENSDALERPSWVDRVSWIGLAAIPSGLLIGVTNYITTDLGSVPFLWVLPLALFLVTFIITFQRNPVVKHQAMVKYQPYAALGLLLSFVLGGVNFWALFLVIHLVSFFVLSMVCHGEMVRRRPKATYLTEFYLLMSFGGMLGGMVTGLLAPQVFSTVSEYPLFIGATMFAVAAIWASKGTDWRRELVIGLGVLAAIILPKLVFGFDLLSGGVASTGFIFAFATLVLWSKENALRVAIVMAVGLFSVHSLRSTADQAEYYRGFFGVNSVRTTSDGQYRAMVHGATIHGIQRIKKLAPGEKPENLSYYHETSGFAHLLEAVRQKKPAPSVAVVGLGAGALACYKQKAESWKFFEIDPLVVMLAKDPNKFTFLSKCAPHVPIVLGDARLTINREKPASFDTIIIDAFTSDAIPVHLMTLEAIRSYLTKLTEGGILLLHISNQNVDLRAVIGAAARELGLVSLYSKGGIEGEQPGKSPALVVALAREPADLAYLKDNKGWKTMPKAGPVAWTDDYSNLLAEIINTKLNPDAFK